MNILDIMKRKEPYCARYEVMPAEMLKRAKELCGEYNRTNPKEKEKRQYYDSLQQNPKAAIIKALDRCSNVSTMAGSFTREKLQEYIVETETYVYPLLTYIKEHYSLYGEAVFVLQYQIMSLLETIKSMEMAAGRHE